MEDPESEWRMQEYSSLKQDDEANVVKWILNKGYVIGRNIAVTGIVITSAPLVLPPLVVVSAMGVAVSVPFGLLFASYACTNKIMRLLLPPPAPPPPLLLEYYKDECEPLMLEYYTDECERGNNERVDFNLGLDGYRQVDFGVENGDDHGPEVEGYYTDKEDNEQMEGIDQGVDVVFELDDGSGDDYRQDRQSLMTNVDEDVDERERGMEMEDMLQGENANEEKERERMEDINLGVEMRPSFGDSGDDQGYEEDVGEYLEEDGDSSEEEHNVEERLVEGRVDENNSNTSEVNEDTNLIDKRRVDDTVVDDYVVSESASNVAYGDVNDVVSKGSSNVASEDGMILVTEGASNVDSRDVKDDIRGASNVASGDVKDIVSEGASNVALGGVKDVVGESSSNKYVDGVVSESASNVGFGDVKDVVSQGASSVTFGDVKDVVSESSSNGDLKDVVSGSASNLASWGASGDINDVDSERASDAASGDVKDGVSGASDGASGGVEDVVIKGASDVSSRDVKDVVSESDSNVPSGDVTDVVSEGDSNVALGDVMDVASKGDSNVASGDVMDVVSIGASNIASGDVKDVISEGPSNVDSGDVKDDEGASNVTHGDVKDVGESASNVASGDAKDVAIEGASNEACEDVMDFASEDASKVASVDVKDAETTGPVIVKEIDSQELVDVGSKNDEPVGEVRHVVILSRGNEENNFNSREVEELDLVAREVIGDASKDERNMESDEKVLRESMGTREITGGNASNDGSEDVILKTMEEHLYHSNADSREIGDSERNVNIKFENLEVVASNEVKENAADENVDVLARSPYEQAPLGTDNAKDASKTYKKRLSKEEKLDDEKMWAKIGAMRAIVGYKAPSQPTCIGELKALYVFTGVEPPTSFEADSDLDEVNVKLRFLMAIVGVK